jgi:hypothetical protein
MVEAEPGLTLTQRLQLIITGSTPTTTRSRPGWKHELQFYAFKCPIHGLVESYPQGHNQKLRCPKCSDEHVNMDHSSRF